METINKVVNTFDNKVSEIFQYIERPTMIKGAIILFLMLYSARIAPVPPKAVLQLFENVYFKLFIFSLILWTAQVSPSTSILIALAFMITINYTTTGKIWEMMDNTMPSMSTNTTVSPTAPTQAIAMQAASTVMADQTANSTVVSNVAQNPNTIVITPSIVQTPQGPTVVNPSVVVSSAVVKDTAGQQVIITPSVTSITPSTTPSSMPSSMPLNTPSTSVTPAQSVNAISVLGQAAMSPAASDSTTVTNIANVAMANVTTQAGTTAVSQLATQASMPVSGTPDKVQAAVQTAIASVPVSSGPSVTADQSVDAIKLLSESAMSPVASDATNVSNVANIAMANIKTDSGVNAVSQLATQAKMHVAGEPDKVKAAAKIAMSGCYPLRNYDMKKVSPNIDGKWSFEDYQKFVPTPQ